MNELIRIGTIELTRFLNTNLPSLSNVWWQMLVVDKLSFQQQRMVQERKFTTLAHLDFAALLRVLDQNWYDLSSKLSLPREGRNWVKELQTVRNKWAHLSSQEMSASEVYRDADTLGRLLSMIDASPETLRSVESMKEITMQQLAGKTSTSSTTDALSNLRPMDMETMAPVEVQNTATVIAKSPQSPFNVGDLVALRSNPTQVMPVIRVIPGADENSYQVFQNNTKTSYYESQLQAVVDETDERRVLTVPELYAHMTSLQILSPSTANLFSLRSGRVTFVSYQYRPVLKLIRSDRPRLLIADEVGVGKTIEAGLIIKELRARMEISSILIICPKALVAERKWFLEMKRFDENFSALDGPLLKHCLEETHLEGEWPENYSKAILPFSLFDSDLVVGHTGRGRSKNKGLINLDPPPKFDLVIVDEAHHIRNSETYLHQGVRFFCDNAQAVVFLSATPVQLGSGDLYTLLNVLRPDLVIDPTSFEQMAEPNRYINTAVQHCRNAHENWPHEARHQLDKAAQTEWGRLFLRESAEFQKVYDRLQNDTFEDVERIGLTRAIEELYTFSSLINRTRRRDIGKFTTRKPETVRIEFTLEQQELHDKLLDVIARIFVFCHGQQNVKFMMSTIRRQAASSLYGLAPLLQDILTKKLDRLELMETSDDDKDIDLNFVEEVSADITSLLEQVKTLDPYDPKVDKFTQVLIDKNKLANNKALVFTSFRHTLTYLARHVQATEMRYGVIHGSIADEERADLRRRFALPKEDANALDVLLSSEVGCEGLDFQFCDFLINYDLPWNPMRIEQRIGRIDRYGQKSETVAIINFVTPGTVDADIYDRCLWRIGVFQDAVGGNEEILGEVTNELRNIVERFDLTAIEREQRLQQLADNSIRQIREEQELESKQAELFGLGVPTQSWQQEIAAAESYWLSPVALQQLITLYLAKRLASEQEYLLGEKPLKTLRLNQDARNLLLEDFKKLPNSNETVAREWEKWLKGGQPNLSVTFDQMTTTENPKSMHLSVTHPLVRQAADHLHLDEAAYAMLHIQTTELPPGSYPFGIYRWRKQGVKVDEKLISVVTNAVLEEKLFSLLQKATTDEHATLPNNSEFEALDALHHSKWRTAQANHIAENRQQVEHRIHSLTVSQQARCKGIEDQIERATNDKIRLMKQSELARANADGQRRMLELEQAANTGDIHASPVLFGVITVENQP